MTPKRMVVWGIAAMLLFVSLEPPTEEGPYSLRNKNVRKMAGEI
jgi:hypothetical protein